MPEIKKGKETFPFALIPHPAKAIIAETWVILKYLFINNLG